MSSHRALHIKCAKPNCRRTSKGRYFESSPVAQVNSILIFLKITLSVDTNLEVNILSCPIHYDMICYDTWYDMRYDMIHEMIWYEIWYVIIYDMIWDMIWYIMIWYDIIWYDVIWYVMRYVMRYDIISFDTMWCDVIWYYVIN